MTEEKRMACVLKLAKMTPKEWDNVWTLVDRIQHEKKLQVYGPFDEFAFLPKSFFDKFVVPSPSIPRPLSLLPTPPQEDPPE